VKKIAIILAVVFLFAACGKKTIPENSLSGNGKLRTETGLATYYADKFNGHSTASGELYNATKYTAAHRKLPFGTIVLVTNTTNNYFATSLQ
jgi:rare lipoprotein A